jgi:hypothetical protein
VFPYWCEYELAASLLSSLSAFLCENSVVVSVVCPEMDGVGMDCALVAIAVSVTLLEANGGFLSAGTPEAGVDEENEEWCDIGPMRFLKNVFDLSIAKVDDDVEPSVGAAGVADADADVDADEPVIAAALSLCGCGGAPPTNVREMGLMMATGVKMAESLFLKLVMSLLFVLVR